MEGPIESLLIMFVAIMAIPFITPYIKVPVIVLEILIGIVLGMFGLIHHTDTLEFLGSFGLVYLMFLAGLEVRVDVIRKYLLNTVTIGLASLLVPFAVGYFLGGWLDVSRLLLGVVFSTTSLGIVLPMTRDMDDQGGNFIQILLGSVILVDILSMFLLGAVFSIEGGEGGGGGLGFSFFLSFAAVLTLFLIPWAVNKRNIREKVEKILSNRIYFEREVRFAFALIFLMGALVEEMGFEAIVGSFVAGLIISEITPKSSRLEEKLTSFGYGFFIPLFFILVGTKVDLFAVFSDLSNIEVLAAILLLAPLAKIAGVGVAARLRGFSWRESLAMGTLQSARLSLIIAAATIARDAGLIDENLFSILVLLAVFSSTLAPALGKWILTWGRESEKNPPIGGATDP